MVSRSRLVMSCSPSWWGCRSPCPISTHPRPQGKGPNSNFKIQFLLNAYHYHTIIKSKNCKLNHPTSVKTVSRSLLPEVLPWAFQGSKKPQPPTPAPFIPPGTTTPRHTLLPLALGTGPFFLQAGRRSKPPPFSPPSAHSPAATPRGGYLPSLGWDVKRTGERRVRVRTKKDTKGRAPKTVTQQHKQNWRGMEERPRGGPRRAGSPLRGGCWPLLAARGNAACLLPRLWQWVTSEPRIPPGGREPGGVGGERQGPGGREHPRPWVPVLPTPHPTPIHTVRWQCWQPPPALKCPQLLMS